MALCGVAKIGGQIRTPLLGKHRDGRPGKTITPTTGGSMHVREKCSENKGMDIGGQS